MYIESTVARLGYWIGHELLSVIRWNNSKDTGKQELKELLQKLLVLTKFAKVREKKKKVPITNVFFLR